MLAEIVAGIECSQSRDRNVRALTAAMKTITIWPFDEVAAFKYGRVPVY